MPHDTRWGTVHARLYDRLWLPLLHRLGYSTLLDTLASHLTTPHSILDIGAGTGVVSRTLLDSFPQATVYSLDLAAACFRHSQAAITNHDSGRIRYVQGHAERLPFGAGTFPAVVSSLLLCHLRDPARCVAEIARVLQPGGIAGVFTRTHDWFGRALRAGFPLLGCGPLYLHSGATLRRAFEHEGFDRVDCARVPHGILVTAVR